VRGWVVEVVFWWWLSRLRCEAGSGGQKVDGGGRCEPDRVREKLARTGSTLALPGGSDLHSLWSLDAQICSLPCANPESR
jgi:hypothetical protein